MESASGLKPCFSLTDAACRHPKQIGGRLVASRTQTQHSGHNAGLCGDVCPKGRHALAIATLTCVLLCIHTASLRTLITVRRPSTRAHAGQTKEVRAGSACSLACSTHPLTIQLAFACLDAGAQRARPCQAHASLQPVPEADQPGRRALLSGGAALAASLLAPRFVLYEGPAAAAVVLLLERA